MSISITVDNDRNVAGIQQLTLDESAALQAAIDANGMPISDPDDDVAATYNSTTNAWHAICPTATPIFAIKNPMLKIIEQRFQSMKRSKS